MYYRLAYSALKKTFTTHKSMNQANMSTYKYTTGVCIYSDYMQTLEVNTT